MGDAPLRIGVLVLPNEPWGQLVARWHRLEAAGVDAIYSCDHFTNPHRPGEPWFEGWAGLTGLASATERVQVGLLVGAIVSRPPTLLAKEAQVIDHLTGGRLVIGLGAGGAPTDQPMWGVEGWSARERADRFAEYVGLVDRLAREEVVDFNGRWYRASGAVMAPGFVQRPRPPLLLAAHGPRTLQVVARHADTWNTFGPTLQHARELSSQLDDACEAIGRDPSEITRSALLGLVEDTAWTTRDELAERVSQWHHAGFGEVVFYDPPYARAGVPCASSEVGDDVVAHLGEVRAAIARG